MRNALQRKTAMQLQEMLGTEPCPRLAELLHACETQENVARELVTGLEPELGAAVSAVLDLVDAQQALTLELVRKLKA